jgi:hypothetical protein
MLQPVIRRILGWITFSLVLVLLLGAPRICRSQEAGPQAGVIGATSLTVKSVTTDLLLFGVLGLAFASPAIAVRMVRRWR